MALLVDETPRSLAESFDAARQSRAVAEAQVERTARSPQRLVDAGQHPPQPAGSVGREQAQAARIVSSAEHGERLLERLAA